MNDFSELAEKIAEAKRRLPLPALLAQLGLGKHAKVSAHCCFHDDEHKSFSVFEGKDGFWHWMCHAGCGDGDEIMFLRKLKGLSLTDAMSLYLEMAGFPSSRPPKSHEYPVSPKPLGSPKSLSFLGSLVYPVSKGQGLDKKFEKELKDLAACNGCTGRNTARERRWQLVRDLRAVEKGIARKLTNGELMLAFGEWYRLSEPFLDPAKTRDVYLAACLAELGKVRVPTGEGDTIKKAVEHVLTLPVSELPVIPAVADAPENWRRVAALHRELSRRATKTDKTYFLTCRDAAKAVPGMIHQTAYNINLALVRFGVIEIVSVGDQRPNGNGKASEFRYLLPQTENAERGEEDAGFEI
jgi:hypothetical protein